LKEKRRSREEKKRAIIMITPPKYIFTNLIEDNHISDIIQDKTKAEDQSIREMTV
jgi:hypothetical protein